MKGAGWQCDQCGRVEVVQGEVGPTGWLTVRSLGDGTLARPVAFDHLCSEECIVNWAQARLEGAAA